MKTPFFYLLIALFTISNFVFSQENDQSDEMHEHRKEKIKAQKISFITESLDLSTDEAQQFWPVYNEYSKKKENIISERMKIMKEIKQKKTVLTEKEAEIIADKFVEYEVNESVLLKDYHVKFKKILPKVKVVKLYQAEHKFKKKLLREMKGKKDKDCKDDEK